MLYMFTNNCKFDLALCLVKLMTLKEHMSGEAPNFTNHAGHETQMMRETVPKILNTIINIFKFQERTSLASSILCTTPEVTMQES